MTLSDKAMVSTQYTRRGKANKHATLSPVRHDQADAPAEWVYSVYDTEHKLARACVDEHMLVTDGHANC